ncbi:ATP-binding protein [Streptomyces durbertensis]
MAVPYGPMGVGLARRRMREELRAGGAPDGMVDDAVLILSELLSNSCRHASPLSPGDSVLAHWRRSSDGRLRIAVTDGGGPTRPSPAKPSVTSHGGRGLSIITTLAQEWGVEDNGESEVTVWAVVGPQAQQPSISPHARLGGGGLAAGMASLAPRGLAGRRRSTRGEGGRSAAGAHDERRRGREAFDGGLDGVEGLGGFEGLERVEGLERIEGLESDALDRLDVLGEVEEFDGGGVDGTAGRRG